MAIKCKPYSEITVESGTHLKNVYICSVVENQTKLQNAAFSLADSHSKLN